MIIELTDKEVDTLKYALKSKIIDVKGLCAIGIGNKETLKNLENIQRKINKCGCK